MKRANFTGLILLFGLFNYSIVPSYADDSFQGSSGARIAYQDSGDFKKTPVVLIHGFPVNHEMWNEQAIALKNSYRVITYDLRGLGQSKIQDGQYTMETMVDDFFSLLDHLKLERVNVVGFSMGGYIALRAIERSPSRFQGLVLADTQSKADSNEAKLKRSNAMTAIKGKSEELHKFGSNFFQSALSPKTFKENPKVMNQLIQMFDANLESGVSGGLLAMISRTDTTTSLSQIKIPTLILVGDEDPITPVKVAQLLNARINGSKMQLISGAGHFSPVENPKEFNSYLLNFLGTVQN
jgi:3-oxoadipate enol-lactonase